VLAEKRAIRRPKSRRGKQKIMIYTPREMINRRDGRNAQNLGQCAKTPIEVINEYASKPAENGRRSGIKCPVLAAARGPLAALNPFIVLGSSDPTPIHRRETRGNINESAEILITATTVWLG